jgi:ParB family transcriptional regulator, chromosome partitioning protein
MKKTGLGKGFDSLIPTNFDKDLLVDKDDRIQHIAVDKIHPNEQQPRKHFDKEALKELSASIKRYGVLQPLIVVPDDEDGFVIVAGERRWRAAREAKLTKLPCIVRKREELEQLEISLIENVQRVDLTPIEQAVSIERLHQEFNMSYQEIAKRLGKAPTTVNNIVRLLGLPKPAREALDKNQISEGHARAILSLKEYSDEQNELLKHVIKEKWSVRQAEQYVTAVKQGKRGSKAKTRTAIENEHTKSISTILNTKVTLRHTARGGKVELHFKNEQELQQLIERLRQLKSS